MANNKSRNVTSSEIPGDATGDPDLDSMKVADLKRYLRDHGEYVSGNKSELLKRAKGVCQIGKLPLAEMKVKDKEEEIIRRVQRLVSPLGENLPDPTSLRTGWSESITDIPNFEHKDLYNYMVLSKSATLDMDSNKAKRQLKAKVFYLDRHVHSVLYHAINNDCSHCYVKCKVIPSLPTQDQNRQPDYQTWVCLSKVSGRVHAAGCECTAGDGESCNHIAALLYALEDITEKKREGLDASTSQDRIWGVPRKRKLSPKKAEEMLFYKVKLSNIDKPSCSKKICSEPEIPVAPPKTNHVDTQRFADKLRKCAPHAAWLLTTEDGPDPALVQPLPKLHQINFMYCDSVDLLSDQVQSYFMTYSSGLQVTQEECVKIEKLTRGQNTNKYWKEAKFGRLTSSNFGLVCKRKEQTAPDCLVKTVLCYKQFDSASVKWGRNHEPAARRFYIRHMKSCNDRVNVRQSGLVVNPKYPHLGASPDGIVTCGNDTGLLEVKCPYKYRLVKPVEAAKDSEFFCQIGDSGDMVLKRNHNYYFQIQGQMAITNYQWCDFFVWTLEGYSVERIKFDANFWSSCVSRLNSFFMKGILPELFSSRIKRGKQLYL